MLMEGVKILNSDMIMGNEAHPAKYGLMVVAGFFLVIGMIALLMLYHKKPIQWIPSAVGLLLFGTMMVVGIRVGDAPVNPIRYTYEVTVADDVNFKQFTDKYKIVNQRGEIYVVQDREIK